MDIFPKTIPILGHKASFNNKKIEITLCILFECNAIKLELKNKSNNQKYVNNWRLNNTLINYQ
jgi:hypothetical protein